MVVEIVPRDGDPVGPADDVNLAVLSKSAYFSEVNLKKALT